MVGKGQELLKLKKKSFGAWDSSMNGFEHLPAKSEAPSLTCTGHCALCILGPLAQQQPLPSQYIYINMQALWPGM